MGFIGFSPKFIWIWFYIWILHFTVVLFLGWALKYAHNIIYLYIWIQKTNLSSWCARSFKEKRRQILITQWFKNKLNKKLAKLWVIKGIYLVLNSYGFK